MEKKKQPEEVINPLDFFDLDTEKQEKSVPESRGNKNARMQRRGGYRRGGGGRGQRKAQQAVFVTGTDTDVGKTVAVCVLGLLLKEQGKDVGVMKPIQCGGQDAKFLHQVLKLSDTLEAVNPYSSKHTLSPHVAFAQENKAIDIDKIKEGLQKIRLLHDLTLIEGAGGLLVPIKDKYLVADLVKDLNCELVIVSRLGLGTINHTLLTIQQARALGIKVKGVIFNEAKPTKHTEAEKTNPDAISKFGDVPVLGTIPFLGAIHSKVETSKILEICRSRINLKPLLTAEKKESRIPWSKWDKEYVWHPFTQMQDWLQEDHPIIMRGKECTLEDIRGRSYIDGISSLWVTLHGHGHPHIEKAIREQLKELDHSTLLGMSNTPAISLARRLVEVAPKGLQKVFFSDNGSTAVEVAIKMAYQYWQNQGQKQKTIIAHLSNAYHGDTIGSVSVGGIDLFHKVFRHLTIKTLSLEFPDFYRVPKGKEYPKYTEECLKRMEGILKRKKKQIAALIVEPIVQGAAGMIVWPEGILTRIQKICYDNDIFLIADEVATGFGRTGKMFACQHENVVPDFLCLAKGITAGTLPLAATLTTKKVFDGFLFDYKDQKTFFHGHTYTGNPICCAAALANLEVFQREQTLSRLQKKIVFVQRALSRFRELPQVGDIRQKGFMIGIELVKDKNKKTPYPWQEKMGIKVCQRARESGVLLRPLGNVIVLMPPLSISKLEMEKLLNVTYAAIKYVTEGRDIIEKKIPRRSVRRPARRRPSSQRRAAASSKRTEKATD